MSNPRIERLTEDRFKDFISRHYFSAKKDNPQFYQAYLHDKVFGYMVLGDDDLEIGAFGLNIAWRGVGEAWLFSTEKLNQYPIWMIKNFRTLTNEALRVGGLHRVQCYVLNCDQGLHKWAKMIGFQFEGVMRKHSAQGEDHAVYSKIQ